MRAWCSVDFLRECVRPPIQADVIEASGSLVAGTSGSTPSLLSRQTTTLLSGRIAYHCAASKPLYRLDKNEREHKKCASCASTGTPRNRTLTHAEPRLSEHEPQEGDSDKFKGADVTCSRSRAILSSYPKRPSPKFLQNAQVRMPMKRRVETNSDKTSPVMRIDAVGARADARGSAKRSPSCVRIGWRI
jgi:hypothetical protein